MTDVTPGQPVHPEKKKGKGCKIALIILGILFVIVVIAIIVMYSYRHEIVDTLVTKSVDAVETQIMENLPEGYDESKVEEAFDGVRRAYERKELDGEQVGRDVQRISLTVQEAFEDKELTTEELDEILLQIREMAGSSE